MSHSLPDRLARGNLRFRGLLNETHLALRGERLFGVQQVRQLSALLTEMAPIWDAAPELRRFRPELIEELDLYRSQLQDLSAMLRSVRMMLLAQRSQIEARRTQVSAVSDWANTMRQTWGPALR
jgi:hypothetical protein